MKPLAKDPIAETRATIINDPELRAIYYDEHMRVGRERAEHAKREAEYESTKEDRMQALWQRLNYDPAEADRRLKAKIKEEQSQLREQRRAEWRQDIMLADALINATRRRLRELGIK